MLTNKFWAIIGACLLILLAIDTAWIFHQKGQLDLAREDQKAKQIIIDRQSQEFEALTKVVKANELAINARDKALDEIKKARLDSLDSFTEAAKKNPDWAGQQVPVEILEIIE